jgi:hypothetical protein
MHPLRAVSDMEIGTYRPPCSATHELELVVCWGACVTVALCGQELRKAAIQDPLPGHPIFSQVRDAPSPPKHQPSIQIASLFHCIRTRAQTGRCRHFIGVLLREHDYSTFEVDFLGVPRPCCAVATAVCARQPDRPRTSAGALLLLTPASPVVITPQQQPSIATPKPVEPETQESCGRIDASSPILEIPDASLRTVQCRFPRPRKLLLSPSLDTKSEAVLS